ncbi:MAG: hypothetical protein K9N34_08405 [Candidatus Marinimicrobia bacterium]|nr:hypothetical protein [Candidatus Neomarinimicrobiota bacterium]MCF7840694.1 hypothetical protein [Candidatus Neomarinimicrobiota bacterium]MCF7902227.1 hypothetical protein [Candidatus Neomarinimicrobiota bacterium]
MQDTMGLGSFFQLLYQFGLSQRDREIAHDLNNHLSVLSMQVNMIARALTREDRELALRKSTEIQETAQRIQQFAEILSQQTRQKSPVEKTNLNDLVEETLSFLKYLPEIADLPVHWEQPKTPVVVSCYTDGVKLTLLSFLYAVKQVADSPQVQLAIDTENRGSPRLTATLRTPSLSGSPLKFPKQKDRLPGAIAMRQLMHNLDGEGAGFRIELNEGETLSATCIFH